MASKPLSGTAKNVQRLGPEYTTFLEGLLWDLTQLGDVAETDTEQRCASLLYELCEQVLSDYSTGYGSVREAAFRHR